MRTRAGAPGRRGVQGSVAASDCGHPRNACRRCQLSTASAATGGQLASPLRLFLPDVHGLDGAVACKRAAQLARRPTAWGTAPAYFYAQRGQYALDSVIGGCCCTVVLMA